MKKQARTISKSSATSFNFGANKTRRSNSRKAAPKKDRVSTSDAQEWTVGQTNLNTLRPIKDFPQPLPAGSPTDIRGGDATTLTVETRAGRTWLPPLAQALKDELLRAALSLEKRVAQIEQQLKDSSEKSARTLKRKDDRLECFRTPQQEWEDAMEAEAAVPPPEWDKKYWAPLPTLAGWTDLSYDGPNRYVTERRAGKETRRLHQERRRNERRMRIQPRRGSGPSPILATPNGSSTDTRTPSDSLPERAGTRMTEHDGSRNPTQR